MTALDLMSQQDAENHIKAMMPEAYVEFATGNVYGTHKGLPLYMSGHGDWKHAIENLNTMNPRYTAFGYYILEA